MKSTYEQKPPDDLKVSYALHSHVKDEKGERVSCIEIKILDVDAIYRKKSQ